MMRSSSRNLTDSDESAPAGRTTRVRPARAPLLRPRRAARSATARRSRHRPRPARRGGRSRVIRPPSTTATRSASCAVCRRWAIATTVRPESTADSERSRCRAARGSSSEVASSSTSVCGSSRTSRASAICWACAGVSAAPPEPTSVVQPLGQRLHPLPRVDRPQRALERGRVGVHLGQAQVVRDRPDEHVVLLGDQGDVPAQLLERQVDQRHAADRDGAVGGRVDAGEHPPERRLAGTGRSDHGQPLTGGQVEVDAVQHVVPLAVRVGQAPGGDVLVDRACPRATRGRARPAGHPRCARARSPPPGSRRPRRSAPTPDR